MMFRKIKNSQLLTSLLVLITLYILVCIYVQSNTTSIWNKFKQLAGLIHVLDKTCNGTIFPMNENNEGNWGAVDAEQTMYVISAYYVTSRNRIFVIGARPLRRVSVICQLWRVDSVNKLESLRQTHAEFVAPKGGKHYVYAPTMLACHNNSTEVPTHVSLVMSSCDNPLNLLRVKDVSPPVKYERKFTVCISPLFGFSDSLRLVEWIEFNKILGADKFVLYNISVSAKVDSVISHYVKSDLIHVVQWRLPFLMGETEFFAQKAAINDCLFRNKNVSEFIINLDTDEFIIPRGKDILTWSRMLGQLDQNCAGYLFLNTFFRTDWKQGNSNVTGTTKSLNLITLTYFEHEERIYSPNDRSKYFARTAYVQFINVHEIPRGRILTVPPEFGLVYHYRNFRERKVYKRVKDFIVLQKFGDILIKNVQVALINLI